MLSKLSGVAVYNIQLRRPPHHIEQLINLSVLYNFDQRVIHENSEVLVGKRRMVGRSPRGGKLADGFCKFWVCFVDMFRHQIYNIHEFQSLTYRILDSSFDGRENFSLR